MNRYMNMQQYHDDVTSPEFERHVSGKYDVIMKSLIQKNHSVTAMESCTGGMIASLLTDTEGASGVLKGAFVTYSNDAKIACGVPREVIETYGVYSAETAEAMAAACRSAYNADLGIGITGSFGNVDPANADSVPGKIYAAVSLLDTVRSECFTLPLGLQRHAYKLLAADAAADLISDILTKHGIL